MIICFIVLQSGLLSVKHIIGVAEHKAHLKQLLRAGQLDGELVFFSAEAMKNVEWENEEEFYLNGEKYDLVKSVVKGQSKGFLCINDKKEEKLIEDFQGTHKKSKSLDELIKKITIQEFPLQSYSFPKIIVETTENNSFLDDKYSSQWVNNIIKPPISQA